MRIELIDAIVPLPFWPYRRNGMDAVDREDLVDLLAEALMRDTTFRPRRRYCGIRACRPHG